MRLIDIDELRGCAIIRPMSHEEMGYILSCSNILIHDEIPTAYDKENDKEIRDKAIDTFLIAIETLAKLHGAVALSEIQGIAEKLKEVGNEEKCNIQTF